MKKKDKEKEKGFIRQCKTFETENGIHTVAIGILVEDETKYGYEIRLGHKTIASGIAENRQEAFKNAVKEYQKLR